MVCFHSMEKMMFSHLILIPIMIAMLTLLSLGIGYISKSGSHYESLRRDSAIDGLRGLLAVSVMTHHFYITYVWKTTGVWKAPEYNALENIGSIPVSLFFMITGFLFLSKIKKGVTDWKELYIGRIKRIYPLYISVAVISFTVLLFEVPHLEVGEILKSIVKWFVFEGGIIDGISTTRLIAGVNWTLAYEFTFYLLLPAISLIYGFKVKNNLLAITLTLAAFIGFHTGIKLYLIFLTSAITLNKIKSIEKKNNKQPTPI